MNSSTSGSEGQGAGPFALVGRMAAFVMVLCVVLMTVAIIGEPGTQVDYFRGMAGKHRRLAALTGPKVVIIGGSNAAFGIDSRALEHALCRPVVNMSMHASLGYSFLVNEVVEYLGPGDLVLAAPEHSLYSRPDKLDDVHYQAVDRHPLALRHVRPLHRPKVVAGVLVMRLRATWRKWTGQTWPMNEAVYRSDGFDLRGDLVGHLSAPPNTTVVMEPLELREELPDKAFADALQQLNEAAEKAGAMVVHCWPALAHGAHNPALDSLIATYMSLSGHPLIGRSMDYLFPDSAFLDTPYHLKSWGRTERSMRLMRDLCASGLVNCCATGRP